MEKLIDCTFVQVGDSSDTVFAWDLRWQQQPIMLSGIGLGESSYSPCESEVWEVQCDSHVQSSFISATILPTMMCSEDGILAVLRQGRRVRIGVGEHSNLKPIKRIHAHVVNEPCGI